MSLKEEIKKILRGEKQDSVGDAKIAEAPSTEVKRALTDSKPLSLHPPKPMVEVIKTSEDIAIDYSDIDFEAIASSSEFRRFIYYIYTGKTHRGTLRQLDKDIKKVKQDIKYVNYYKDVMKELKEKVGGRKIE